MTRKFILVAGAAAMALAGPAAGERGGNRDRDTRAQSSQAGNDRKAQRAERQRSERAERPQRERQRSERAERPQRAERQRSERSERPQRVERQRSERAERSQRVERQRTQRAERQRTERPQRVERQRTARAEHPQRVERQRTERAERPQRVERERTSRAERPQRVERQRTARAERPQRVERQRTARAERTPRVERQRVQQAERRSLERHERRQNVANDRGTILDRRNALRENRREFRERGATATSWRNAAWSDDRPVRPMRFRADPRIVSVGERINPLRFTGVVPAYYRTRYYDTRDYYYRYDDDLGYLYRIDYDDDYVKAVIPLYGGYGFGDPWPNIYYSSYVPFGYRNIYYDTPDYYYRYDGYGIYQIDATTQLITALVALLTGPGYGVGQYLPASYGAYNVPLDYRSTYYDHDDAWYRYGDGYIYQLEPHSRLVEARYPLYADNYLIGDPWPVAYPGYNVPYGYQSLYYDTPEYHYRYANGAIYQVDPTTQVILALVALASGQPFAVGQPLPPAYAAYNVPLAYRDRYFDDDDDWYRYADGYIYRVDPYDRLIREAIPIYA